MASGVGAAVYTSTTPVDVVIETEMGQLGTDSPLSKDEKLAKISRAEQMICKIEKEIPLNKLKKDLADLKNRVSNDTPVDSTHSAVKRCKILFKHIIGMIRDMDDSHPFLKDIPQRFLVFRNK